MGETYDILNSSWPHGWSPDSLIDAMQTGDRISYRPETAVAELHRLPDLLAKLPQDIESLRMVKDSPVFLAMVRSDRQLRESQDAQTQMLARLNGIVNLALAHLADAVKTQPQN